MVVSTVVDKKIDVFVEIVDIFMYYCHSKREVLLKKWRFKFKLNNICLIKFFITYTGWVVQSIT